VNTEPKASSSDKLIEAMQLIDEHYLHPADREALIDAALNATFAHLDASDYLIFNLISVDASPPHWSRPIAWKMTSPDTSAGTTPSICSNPLSNVTH